MYNLGTVVRFELARTLKKKTFWIMALAFPLAMCAILAISYFSSKATEQAAEATKKQKFSIEVMDQSEIIDKNLIRAFGASESNNKAGSIAKVKAGKLDAFFFYPKNLDKNNVEVYAKNISLFDNGRYEGVAKILIQQSVAPTVSPQTTAILQDKVKFQTTTYKDGKAFDGFRELIAPGLFLVLFYFMLATFGNQMLTSTIEEKENRIIEMILTTIKAKTLIIGKILSLVALAFIQIIIMLLPIAIAFIFFRDSLSLPNFDLSSIPLDASRIITSALIFIFSFLMFTGILVAIGAVAPTAKEAGSFIGVFMISIFAPLYAASLFVSAPDSAIVRFLTFFPLSAPIPLLLRNAIGNLSFGESIIGIIILAISASLTLSIAIRAFGRGSLEYSKLLSLRSILKK